MTSQPLQLRSVSGPAVDCDLCIHIVKHWRDILVANTTKEEFKEILDGICSKTKAWAPKVGRRGAIWPWRRQLS